MDTVDSILGYIKNNNFTKIGGTSHCRDAAKADLASSLYSFFSEAASYAFCMIRVMRRTIFYSVNFRFRERIESPATKNNINLPFALKDIERSDVFLYEIAISFNFKKRASDFQHKSQITFPIYLVFSKGEWKIFFSISATNDSSMIFLAKEITPDNIHSVANDVRLFFEEYTQRANVLI